LNDWFLIGLNPQVHIKDCRVYLVGDSCVSIKNMTCMRHVVHVLDESRT
jgi:hypothetical protein